MGASDAYLRTFAKAQFESVSPKHTLFIAAPGRPSSRRTPSQQRWKIHLSVAEFALPSGVPFSFHWKLIKTQFYPAQISGGGIAGLCLAISLSAHPHLVVDLYEATGQFKEIGAGVMIWSRTWRILELMGLANEFSKIAHAPPTGTQGRVQTDQRAVRPALTFFCQAIGFDFRRSDQDHEGFRFKSVEMPCETCFCLAYHHLPNYFLIDGVCHITTISSNKLLKSNSWGSAFDSTARSFSMSS